MNHLGRLGMRVPVTARAIQPVVGQNRQRFIDTGMTLQKPIALQN